MAPYTYYPQRKRCPKPKIKSMTKDYKFETGFSIGIILGMLFSAMFNSLF